MYIEALGADRPSTDVSLRASVKRNRKKIEEEEGDRQVCVYKAGLWTPLSYANIPEPGRLFIARNEN